MAVIEQNRGKKFNSSVKDETMLVLLSEQMDYGNDWIDDSRENDWINETKESIEVYAESSR